MKTVSVTEFKAKALRMIDDVEKTKEQLTLTKRGKPVAQVIPYQGRSRKFQFGKLAAYLVYEGDIVSPLGEKIWEASR